MKKLINRINNRSYMMKKMKKIIITKENKIAINKLARKEMKMRIMVQKKIIIGVIKANNHTIKIIIDRKEIIKMKINIIKKILIIIIIITTTTTAIIEINNIKRIKTPTNIENMTITKIMMTNSKKTVGI